MRKSASAQQYNEHINDLIKRVVQQHKAKHLEKWGGGNKLCHRTMLQSLNSEGKGARGLPWKEAVMLERGKALPLPFYSPALFPFSLSAFKQGGFFLLFSLY